ncbi:MAG: hypothetical protein AAGI30_05585 [Planctomycetota bacterium]
MIVNTAVQSARAVARAAGLVIGLGMMAVAPAGEAQLFPAAFELSSLASGDGAQGFILNGIDLRDGSGRWVSSAGDVNGDGVDDLAIGVASTDQDPFGFIVNESYVVFGRRGEGFGATLDLSSLNGDNGFVLNGVVSPARSSMPVSAAGDVNGDGIDDLIIGSPYADGGSGAVGESYVVFGQAGGEFEASFDLSALDGSNGFVLSNTGSTSYTGTSVSSAGDINGDGVDDLIIRSRPIVPLGGLTGQSYVVFGRHDGAFGASLDLSTPNASDGLILNVTYMLPDLSSGFSGSVSSAGDVNGDGVDDLIIGEVGAGAPGEGFLTPGASYVVFGRQDGEFGGSLELSALNGSNGFALNGIDAGDRFGTSVSSAGDVNGDGIDDLIIGASRARPQGRQEAGQSYVIFGRSDGGFDASLELSMLDGSNGFTINGIDWLDRSGTSVSSGGDVNADGIDDLIIGGVLAGPNGNLNAGESYVIFGRRGGGFGASFELSTLDGINGFVINGIDPGDASGVSVSAAGDVNADGVDDLVIGARRADANGVFEAGQSYVVFGRRCPGDLDGDHDCDADDFLSMLVGFGRIVDPQIPGATRRAVGDLDADGLAGATDFLEVLVAFGSDCLPD